MDGTNEWIDGPLPAGHSLAELRDRLPMTGPAGEATRTAYAEQAGDWVCEQVEEGYTLARLCARLTSPRSDLQNAVRTRHHPAFVGAMFRGLYLAEVQRREPVDPVHPEPEVDPTMDPLEIDAPLPDGQPHHYLSDLAGVWVDAELPADCTPCDLAQLRKRLTTFTGLGELDVRTGSDISRVSAMIRGLHLAEVLRREMAGNP